ncbi:histidine phosphatase family protein, partial [Desulfovibrio sp. OttesenSCG-928-M16]|nr:histidine phosphatase family protein [Desulfovibrio sp. OttesenSCG-928-M16]
MKKVRPRIVLVRHGLAAPKGLMLGQSDVPLLPEGREQIAKLALRLAGMRFCAAWCSPLLRARQSAAILLAA